MAKEKISEEALLLKALVKARAALEDKGVAGAAQLGSPKLRPQVVHRLQQEGFELAGKRVRVPLESQLSALVEAGAHTPLTQLAKRLGGTTSAEAKKSAIQLCKAGGAQLILRGKVLSLVPASESTLEPQALKRLVLELTDSLKWLKKAATTKPSSSVLRSDWAEVLELWTSLLSSVSASAAPPRPQGDWASLRGVLMALADEDTGLTSVPVLAQRLSKEFPQLDLKLLLLSAHRKSRVELRPEGGIGRLSADEVALCPRGAGGLPLSWVRLLGEGA